MENHPVFKALKIFVATFKWLEALACIWFLRLCSLPALAWGLWDAWRYYHGDPSPERADDAAIRTTAGIILSLCWLFLARRKGKWTLNKNGILERWPLRKDDPPAVQPSKPAKRPYASPSAGKYN